MFGFGYMNKTKTMQIGITSLLGNGKHVMLLESDNEFNIRAFIDWFNFCFSDSHITIYKSNKGYHMISLNEFDYINLLHFCIRLLRYNMICNKQLGFAIRQEAFTLRITEKTLDEYNKKIDEMSVIGGFIEQDLLTELIITEQKPKEIVYHQWGSLPISKPHYEVFELFLNNPKFIIKYNFKFPVIYEKMFFDHGYELKGYEWEE